MLLKEEPLGIHMLVRYPKHRPNLMVVSGSSTLRNDRIFSLGSPRHVDTSLSENPRNHYPNSKTFPSACVAAQGVDWG